MCVDEDKHSTTSEGSLKVHRTRSVRRAELSTEGRSLVSHAGTALLSELADRSRLTPQMSVAMGRGGMSWHTHGPVRASYSLTSPSRSRTVRIACWTLRHSNP
jgi:hypothetical protein